MKKITTRFAFLLSLLLVWNLSTAQLSVSTTYTNNNGSAVSVFTFYNSNPYPVMITSIGTYAGSTATQTAQFWTKPATGFDPGAVGAISVANGWTLQASQSVATVANTTATNGALAPLVLSGLSVTIPANSYHRFCVSLTSIRYSTLGTQQGSFTANGCTIDCSANDGYGGTLASPINTPRGFIGIINFIPLNGSCSGAPNNGLAAISNTGGCPGVSFNLSASGLTNGIDMTYQWQSSSSSTGPWTNVTGATNQNFTTSVTSTTYFQLVSTCTTSAQSSTSNAVSYTVNNPGPCVCGAYPYFAATSTADEDIGNVTVGSMNNTTTCANTGGTGSALNLYSNFTGSVAGTSEQVGSTVNFSLTSITCGGNYNNGFQIYIDYNQNGSFADPGEQVYTSAASVSGPHTETGSFVIPVTATIGTTRMRVVCVETTFPVTANYATTNYTWGETEDYCINILAATNCTGTPSGGTAAISSASGCPGVNFNLTSTGYTVGSGITLQWQSSSSASGPWTDILGANSPNYTTSAVNSTFYQLLVTCTNSGQSSASNAVSYTVNNPGPCICGAYPLFMASSTADEDIGDVTVGTMTNTSTCTSVGPGSGSVLNRYSNYTGTVAPHSELQGQSVNFSLTSITCGGNYGNGFQIYIDYNQNGSFADPGEQVYSSAASTTGPHTETGSFTIPITATPGTTRMRVVCVETTFPTTINYATAGYTWGETEDYCFTVLSNPPCTGTPVAGTISGNDTLCAGNSTTLTLNGCDIAPGISYLWSYSYSPSGPFTNADTTITLNSGLLNDTIYYQATVTCNLSGQSATTVLFPVLVNPLPTITLTQTTTTFCAPNGPSPVVTASGPSTSYTWNPAAGLSNSSASTVTVTPTASTIYTVTGVDQNACSNTATISINYAQGVILSGATATPSSLCSGDSTVLIASAALGLNTYCQPATSCTFPDIISNVTFSTINNNTSCDGASTGGFTLFSAPNPTITAGTSLPISVTTSGDIEGAAIWIDFDQNGNFDPTELITNGYLGTNPATYTATVNVPLTVVNGTTRMRVRCSYASDPINLGPCANTTYGETEDYLVTFIGGVDPLTYNWSPATFLNVPNNDTVHANGMTNSVDYFLTVTAASGCQAVDTVSVIVNPLPVSPTIADTIICSGNSTTLSTSGTGTISWYDAVTGGNFIASGNAYTTPVLSSSVSYFVQDSSAGGCASLRTQVDVTVNPTPAVTLGADIIQCGGSVTLDAQNPGASYMWNNQQSTQSINVSASGSFNVAVTNGFNCTGYDSINVTINYQPVVNLGADTSYCANAIQLDAQNPGNIYQWNTGDTSQFLNVSASGSYDVVVSTPQGCFASDTVNLVLTPTPIVNLGNDTTLCGGNIILDAQNTGSTYTWSDNSTFPIIFVSTTGTYWVDVTNPQNCTTRDSIVVTVNTAPVVNLGPDLTLCAGDSVVLNAGSTAGASYLWSDNSTAQTLAVSSTGVYYVTASTAVGCSASDTASVTVYPYPAPNIALNLPVDSICANVGVIHLTGESPAGGTFSGPSVSGNNFDASIGAGVYLISYTITDSISGCSNSASQNMYVDACLGINHNNLNPFAVYPNPTNGGFFIESNTNNGKTLVEISDPQGKLVYSESFGTLVREDFDLSAYGNGIYMIRLISADQVHVFRVTLNR